MMARDEAWPLDLDILNIEEIVEKDTYYDTNSTIEMLAFAFPERQEFKDAIKEELKKWKTLDLSRYPESVVMYSDVYFFCAHDETCRYDFSKEKRLYPQFRVYFTE
ncbi:uncharacterized protein [Mytilus edulis]|uniref:uncharacterized protein n=1 Tax=Mytilus edulis TaxID=6550 RepID=UPI0039EF0496